MDKKVAIIIINMNGKDFLKNCLNPIKKNTLYKNYKVIVVDNNSSDGSQEMLKSKFKWVDLIENKENLGFSKANNIGIEYAINKYYPDYFYLLNNDTKVTKGWLNEAIKTAEKEETIGIVGSKQLNFEGKSSISAGWIRFLGVKYYWGNEEKEVNWVSGACFLIKKKVIDKIGYLDEAYSPAYYEESDFEKRAINSGFKILHCPRSIIYHKGGGTINNEGMNDKMFLVFYRNRIRFFLRYYPTYIVPRIIYDILKSIKPGKTKKLRLLIKAYKEGIKSIKSLPTSFTIN